MYRRRRTNRDMGVLAGWLFADLLLGLAMLFFTANTVGQSAPTPTPTASPNFLATSEARNAAQATEASRALTAAEATATAQAAAIEAANAAATQAALQATQTAAALATEAAMSADERATANAQATASAIAAEATLAAFATQEAAQAADIDEITRQQATAAAEATAAALAAQATLDAQATQAADVAAIATQNALSGANALATAEAQAAAAQATIDALSANQVASDSAVQTAQAQLAAIQATADALATLQALPTPTPLPQVGIDPTFDPVTMQVDIDGVLDGDEQALDQAREELQREFGSYTAACRAAVVITYGHGPSVAEGVELARRMNALATEEFPAIFAETGFRDISSGVDPFGQVEMEVFLYSGCPALEGG